MRNIKHIPSSAISDIKLKVRKKTTAFTVVVFLRKVPEVPGTADGNPVLPAKGHQICYFPFQPDQLLHKSGGGGNITVIGQIDKQNFPVRTSLPGSDSAFVICFGGQGKQAKKDYTGYVGLVSLQCDGNI